MTAERERERERELATRWRNSVERERERGRRQDHRRGDAKTGSGDGEACKRNARGSTRLIPRSVVRRGRERAVEG